MKNCMKCKKELPNEKGILCEHCQSQVANGAKKIGSAILGLGVGALLIVSNGKIDLKKK